MKRFIGKIAWIDGDYKIGDAVGGDTGKIIRGILKDNIFKLDNTNPNGLPNSEIRLRSKNGFNFDGSAKFVGDSVSSSIINLKMYSNQGNVILIGDWKEGGKFYTCIAELEEVIEFKD